MRPFYWTQGWNPGYHRFTTMASTTLFWLIARERGSRRARISRSSLIWELGSARESEPTPLRVEIDGKSRWADFLPIEPNMYPHLLVSDRVNEFIRSHCRPEHVKTKPVEILDREGTDSPGYFVVLARPGIRVTRSSAIDTVLRPQWETWNGEMLLDATFADGQDHKPLLFCSDRFIDAYVERRWTGARFKPIDLPGGPHFGWSEVDTRRRNWRATMYPPQTPPEEFGKYMEALASPEAGIWFQASLALAAGGDAAAAVLIEAFRSAPPNLRERVAYILNLLAERCASVPEAVHREAVEVLRRKRENDRSRRR